METAAPSSRDLENLWRAQVQAGFQRYRLARAFAESARVEFLRVTPASPEAYRIVHKCIQNERAALADYLRVLDIFSDLTMHGKMPPKGARAERAGSEE